MEILGKTIVFSEKRKGYTFFRASISTAAGETKKGEKEYNSLSLDIRFVGEKYNSKKMKDKFNSIEDGKYIAIDIKKGFLAVDTYTTEDGSIKKKLILNVLDAEFSKDGWKESEKPLKQTKKSSKAKTSKTSKKDEEVDIEEDDLPF